MAINDNIPFWEKDRKDWTEQDKVADDAHSRISLLSSMTGLSMVSLMAKSDDEIIKQAIDKGAGSNINKSDAIEFVLNKLKEKQAVDREKYTKIFEDYRRNFPENSSLSR